MADFTEHSGRYKQTFIYLGKLFRMLIFQNDWKVLPMAAVITGAVCFVISDSMFVTMDGTIAGTFALSCVCIWNGFFNSIQSICRERPIIKREHRSGLHMTSYIAAHMIYQAFICFSQVFITLTVMNFANVKLPTVGYVTGIGVLDLGITLFMTTYAADMMALFVSSIVRNTTTAMTIMPFLLIFQLVFSGVVFFKLPDEAEPLSNLTISKWGMSSMCAEAGYNDLPNNAILTVLDTMDLENIDVPGDEGMTASVSALKGYLSDDEAKKKFAKICGEHSPEVKYESTDSNIGTCWIMMGLSIFIFPCLAVISLEFIDRDRR